MFGISIQMSDGTIATDIKDIKPPLNFAVNWKLWLAVGFIVCLAAAGFLVYLIVRKRAEAKSLLAPTAHEIAYSALNELKESHLIRDGLAKEYFFRLSFIVRQYLENRFGMRAPEMTTEEFLTAMKDSVSLSQQIKNVLKDFLEKSDMVKFAKYGPTANEILGAFNAAKKLIDETKDNTASLRAPTKSGRSNL